MWIALAFLLGIANFTAQRAVMASRHKLIVEMSQGMRRFVDRISFVWEFALLLAALWAAFADTTALVLLYLGYTALNVPVAWLISNRRI